MPRQASSLMAANNPAFKERIERAVEKNLDELAGSPSSSGNGNGTVPGEEQRLYQAIEGDAAGDS